MRRNRRTALAAAPVVALAVACSGSGSEAARPSSPSVTPTTTVTSPTSATTGTTATTTATGSPGGQATASTDLPDGRHPARIQSVDAARGRIVVDVVQWFTGEAALEAAAEDGAPEPPNDFYIRNANDRLRTLTVAPDAAITINTLGAAESGSATKDIPTTLAELARNPGLRHALFWVTLRDGRVDRLAEQYLP